MGSNCVYNKTSKQAEAKAICEAARWFRLNRMDSENYVRIFTDSQATLQALHNPHVTSCLLYTSDAADE